MFVACFIFSHMCMDDMNVRKMSMLRMGDKRERMLQDQFTVSMNHVHTLVILISSFDHRRRPFAFDDYASLSIFLSFALAYAPITHTFVFFERGEVHKTFMNYTTLNGLC